MGPTQRSPRFTLWPAVLLWHGLQHILWPAAMRHSLSPCESRWHVPGFLAYAMADGLRHVLYPMAYAVPYGLRHALWQ